ncbi:MAG: septum formation protein Maf [Flavobacteriaceae bacterium]|nr:MAG: septum formation protein Maf [Flavobacteriaceae bacterium]
MKNTKKISLILGSSSPRRKELLSEMDFDFTVSAIDVEEVFPEHLQKEKITEFLANLKAEAYSKSLLENELLITSDTLVWADKALGKPKDDLEAKQMLQTLSGKTHWVISSVCLKSNHKKKVFSDQTKVTFAKLSKKEIQYYISKYPPLDKAGSYGIQDWIGHIGIKKIQGSYTTVMGLPTHKLYKALKAW